MALVRHAETRRSETPSAVMTTYASPTLGGSRSSLWRAEVGPEVKGPVHVIDAEQVWLFLSGDATVELDGETFTAAAGDTVVLPANAVRQLVAGPAGYAAVVTAPGDAQAWAVGSEAARITPPWIA